MVVEEMEDGSWVTSPIFIGTGGRLPTACVPACEFRLFGSKMTLMQEDPGMPGAKVVQVESCKKCGAVRYRFTKD